MRTEQEILEQVRLALREMLDLHRPPHRRDMVNETAWRHAVAIHNRAEAIWRESYGIQSK